MAGNDNEDFDQGDGDGEDAGTAVSPKEIIGFVVRAVKQRWKLAASVFVVLLVLGVIGSKVVPKNYHCEFRVQPQPNSVIIEKLGTGAVGGSAVDHPSKGSNETIMKKTNLEKVVLGAKLLENWDIHRAPALRFKDKLVSTFLGPMSDTDRLGALVGILERKVMVFPEDQAVTVMVEWSDPETTFDLAKLVQSSFLEARRSAEAALVTDAVSVLEERAKEDLTGVDNALKELDRVTKESRRAQTAARDAPPPPSLDADASAPVPPPVRVAPRPAPPVEESGPTAAELSEQLAEKRRSISDREHSWQRRIQELGAQLEEQRATLGAAHPTLVATEKRLESAREEPSELAALKGEERKLVAQLADRLRAAAATSTAPRGTYVPPTTTPRGETGGVRIDIFRDDDPQITYARNRLESAIHKYEARMQSIDNARTLGDATKRSFQYRYDVVRVPEYPKGPQRPKGPLVLVAGVGGGILLAILIPVALAFATGRIQESWQVRAQLKLPVLAEVKLPPAP